MAPKGQKRINAQIQAPTVSVITDDGENLGIMPIQKALELAESKELDLVEIGLQNGVVLTKVIDYGKFLFKQQKTQSQGRASSKKADVKTLKITYKIGDHDLDIRRTQAKKFSALGHPLKVMLTLRGRENQYVSLANQKMREFVASLSDYYKTSDVNISKTGNNFSTLLYPKK